MCMAMGNKWTALANLQEDLKKDEHRTKPRFKAREVTCERGRVSDMSASGLRIVYSRCPKFLVGDLIDLELFSNLGQHNCLVEVVRVTKLGFRKYEVGLRFTDPAAAKEMQIFRLGYDPMNDDGKWSIR